MNLYLLETNSLGNFYLVAKSPNEAKDRLEGDLNKSDYGFFSDREVRVITLLVKEIEVFAEGKPNFSSKNRLIISKP